LNDTQRGFNPQYDHRTWYPDPPVRIGALELDEIDLDTGETPTELLPRSVPSRTANRLIVAWEAIETGTQTGPDAAHTTFPAAAPESPAR